MKLRSGFVSNSSSSSFVVIYEIDYNDVLKDYIKEEFGKYGLTMANRFFKGKNEIIAEYEYELEGNENTLFHDKTYIAVNRISWPNDGNKEGGDCWFVDHIPDEYKKLIYEGESY